MAKTQIKPLVNEAFERRGIPKTEESEWAKREASRWPFDVPPEFEVTSALLYYEACQWAKRIYRSNAQERVSTFVRHRRRR